MERTELRDGAWVDYDPHFLPPEEASELLAHLIAVVPWEQKPIVVFGRELMQPRLIGWGGDIPYRYSAQTLPPRPLIEALSPLQERLRELCGVPFNHALFNRYRHGHDKMGLHADNEPELGKDPVIASISLGARRRFRIVPKDKRARKKESRNLWLEHGSLLVMGGRMQHTWRHEMPGVNGLGDERINLTFRWIKGPPGWRGD